MVAVVVVGGWVGGGRGVVVGGVEVVLRAGCICARAACRASYVAGVDHSDGNLAFTTCRNN